MQDLVLCGIPKGMVQDPRWAIGTRQVVTIVTLGSCYVVTIEDLMAMKYKILNTTQKNMYLEPIERWK
ncbi:hypothetical protein BCIN_07g03790 [Botrytis cinerea B05.10]|uniref:Uncharacterized protein n=2 Tax=Sclerotiniaceae TaxID=28983 RepID=A0A384JMS4_BOTFB|nr:hypothetical protein BCIN_07g03790 [Botrytis cinerea B05.10]XP_024549812.1 hypothetical protein BCIN_07g03790 [Botrytis cinerea B05.10]ATZ51810.1 hypothetical protein BCIN_07g03790 [Botrytis cinerea B05.10]ATZ51811.1 hypothetical protein BCIN_07g03790 [Botrytis cinerea B05.10]